MIMAAVALSIAVAATAHGDETVLRQQQTEVIAHRGYWRAPGAVQNSRASLRSALALNVYGSETDVWLTTDGELMANHDASFKGTTIKDSDASACRALTLDNGETMPSLNDFIEIMKGADSPTKLIIEVKDHGSERLNRAAASAAVAAVTAADIADRVEYISFAPEACLQVIADSPDAKVAYLTGGVAPSELRKQGYTGIDYHMNELRAHPEWVAEAHGLGMTVNVWTATSESDIEEMRSLGVDFVTTDDPAGALKMLDAGVGGR